MESLCLEVQDSENISFSKANDLKPEEQTNPFQETLEFLNPKPLVIQPRWAILWVCSNCGKPHVSNHKKETVKKCIEQGSGKGQLRATGTTCECGKKGQRLHSAMQSWVYGVVDYAHPNEVRNLKACAEELDARREQGKTSTIKDFNTAWFENVRGSKQGKGKKFWSKPIRKWRTLLGVY